MSLTEQINEYINNTKKQFTLSEFISKLPDKLKQSEKKVEDILEESYLLFRNHDKEETVFIPRNNFFRNSEFFISPTKTEIENGYLIPGHRFIPFYPFEELFPGESFDITTHDEELICSKQKKYSLKELYKYHFLLGAENISDHFIAEHKDNKDLLGNADNKIFITVFDFKNYFLRNSFKEGQLLKFKVINWADGEFKVSIVPRIEDDNSVDDFIEEMEDALFKIFDKFNKWIEIPEQFAWAYFFINRKYLKAPKLSIENFVNLSHEVDIKHTEESTILWFKSSDEKESENDSPLAISQGNIESLDTILNEIHNFISSIEIESFIKDSLYNGSDDANALFQKIFSNENPINFNDKAQEVSFKNFYEDLFETIAQQYKTEIQRFAELRSKILDELSDFYQNANFLKQKNSEDYDNLLANTKQCILFIRKFLQQLNNEFYFDSNEEFEQLDKEIFSLIKQLNEEVKKIFNLD